ncbi:hypothetical protein [Pedobacter sp. SL55]|uniref:hypothetical protein n=1 Tax=Pedobacter sp. SL55 TaxID=2995161 RepID=UPI002270211C|nr:hypothetical protein [Pedobacter sp. SL55]WAC40583.1 hypothetical protein OVA16_18760 [Pedobacter sp. SL55]
MQFDSQEVAYADMSVRIFDSTLAKLRGLGYEKETETEALYAAGNQPIGIQDGNVKYSGNLKVLNGELQKLNAAAKAAGYADIQEVPYQVIVITVTYREGFGRPLQTDVLRGVKFSKYDKGMSQNDKFKEVEIPFLYLSLSDK